MKALLPLLLVFACKCPPKATTTTTPEPTGSGSAVTPAPAPTTPPGGSPNEPAPTWPAAKPGLGENCGEGDACAQGMTCVAYYGIAGPRGPQFKTCEIRCDKDNACPAEHTCVTIADGPGQVCRK